MYCNNCRMDFPSGASRCPNCLGWLRAKGGGSAPVPFWLKSLEESYMQPDSPVPTSKQAMLEEVLRPKPEAPQRVSSWPKRLAFLLLLALLGGLGWLAQHLKEQSTLPDLSRPPSFQEDVARQGEDKARQARAALQRKDWAGALRLGEAAYDLLRPLPKTSPALLKELQALCQQARLRQAESLLVQAGKPGNRKALEQCREAQVLLKRAHSPRLQARALALESRLHRQLGDLYAARTALEQAHQLDPKAGYQGALRQLDKATRAHHPKVKPSASNPMAPATVIPRLDDEPAYPTGKTPPIRTTAPEPQHVPVAAMPPKKAPPPAYIPPRKKPKPKKPSDQLPSYNDGI